MPSNFRLHAFYFWWTFEDVFYYSKSLKSIFWSTKAHFHYDPLINSTVWIKEELFIISGCTDQLKNSAVDPHQIKHDLRCWLNRTSPSFCRLLSKAGHIRAHVLCRRRSDHLQRVSVSLGHHHHYAVRKTHSQPLSEHRQEAPLTVAVVTQDDAGALRHGVQNFMVGHFTWIMEITFTVTYYTKFDIIIFYPTMHN